MTRMGTHRKWDCTICDGQGGTNCSSCLGTGLSFCGYCKGTKKLKWSVFLSVKFETQIDEFLKKSEYDIPDEQLKSCEAISIFSDINENVIHPILIIRITR